MADDVLLNSREMATLFWLSVLAVFAVSMARRQFAAALRLALGTRLLILWLFYAGSLVAAVLMLGRVGLAYPGASKDALVWALFAGLPLFTKFGAVGRDPSLLVRALRDAVAATVFVEFFVNLYVFPLLVELLVQPVVVLLVVLQHLPPRDAAQERARRVAGGVLAVLGVASIAVAASWFLGNLGAHDVRSVGLSFAQPVVLTALVVVLTFLAGLYSAYQSVVAHMRIAPPRESSPTVATICALVVVLHLRVDRVAGFAGYLPGRLKAARTFRSARRLALAYREGRTDALDRSNVVPVPGGWITREDPPKAA